MDKKIVATNRKAFHNFSIIEKYDAGLVLSGYEVKSLRAAKANLTDGLARFKGGEAFLENIHIAPYVNASTHVSDYEPTRARKLLLRKPELKRLNSKTREKGFTLVPLEIYFSPKGFAKVVLGLAKGKTTYDKREAIKEKDIKKQMRKEKND